MKLRDRKAVHFLKPAAAGHDASSDASPIGKRTRAAKADKSNVRPSSSKGAVVVPDSEESEDDFESPVAKIRRTNRGNTKLRRAEGRISYKESSSSSEDGDDQDDRESDCEGEEPRKKSSRSRSPAGGKQDAKEKLHEYARRRGDRPTRACTVKSSNAVDPECSERPKKTVKPKRRIVESDDDTVVVGSHVDDDEEEKHVQSVPSGYTVGKYGLEVDGKLPSAVKPRSTLQIEKILAVRDSSTGSAVYCAKEWNKSYRSAISVGEQTLQRYCPTLLRNFLKRMESVDRVDGHPGTNEQSPAFDPQHLLVDRIIAAEYRGRTRKYFVKWKGLPYSDATWEQEASLKTEQAAIQRFMRYSAGAPGKPRNILSGFRDGRVLRDYQKEGVAWLDRNYDLEVNSVLADEMGLGKTIQSVAMLESLRAKRKIEGPFLVIAPVSTLGHWQREIESLTDMNCVVYTGNQDDRTIIQTYEFWNSKAPKFTVLLTSFEILMKDKSVLAGVYWKYVVVDEAHRLKSRESKTSCALNCLKIKKGGLLLLTGTPVQNNTKEIFSLLSLLDPEEFNSEDRFLKKYGNIKDIDQVRDLQENILRPRLLRRMKEDVEKSIPLKEETIIWIELTKEQRTYYRAIYENRIHELMKGSQTSNLPNLRNMCMELRKVCNHPFLCDGLEDDFNSKFSTDKGLVQASGKMVLLDKMLPMLKNEGHRVLIFSQFKIMLDILEDYLNAKGFTFERIDGNVRGSERQAAIDRYSASNSNVFVFLLSTRAGGLGITLTAADTCIIYDSDWNPQNDLQAMARCHRIGQTKDVKVYRLITKNTYEQHLFECSSRKYGLDEAVLGKLQDEQQDFSKNIEKLLRHGAYDMMREDGDQEFEAFDSENIDHILKQRTQKRTIGGRGNNTFSVATFASVETLNHGNANPDLEMDAEEFWKKMIPEACDRALNQPARVQYMSRRLRAKVDYSEKQPTQSDDIGSDQSAVKSESEPEQEEWSKNELRRLEDVVASYGRLQTGQLVEEAWLKHRSIQEVEEVVEAIVRLCQYSAAKTAAELPTLPVIAEKALKEPRFMKRLEKNASRYLRVIEEREIISKIVKNGSLSVHIPRSNKLPRWWTGADDFELIKGVYFHGHKRGFDQIKGDLRLSFASKVAASENSDEQSQSSWPSDFVLYGRVKKIIRAAAAELQPEGSIDAAKKPADSTGGSAGMIILKQNKRIVSERPDQDSKRVKTAVEVKQRQSGDGSPAHIQISSSSSEEGPQADRSRSFKSSSLVRSSKPGSLSRRKSGGTPAPATAAPMNSTIDKENVIPQTGRRRGSSEKQTSLLGFFSPKARD